MEPFLLSFVCLKVVCHPLSNPAGCTVYSCWDFESRRTQSLCLTAQLILSSNIKLAQTKNPTGATNQPNCEFCRLLMIACQYAFQHNLLFISLHDCESSLVLCGPAWLRHWISESCSVAWTCMLKLIDIVHIWTYENKLETWLNIVEWVANFEMLLLHHTVNSFEVLDIAETWAKCTRTI